MDLLNRIRQQGRAQELRRLEVPEWGEVTAEGVNDPAQPLVAWYRAVTLEDQSFVHQAANGDRWKMAAHLVALKLLDADGKRLFRQIDATVLMEEAQFDVVTRLSMAMLGGLTLEQAAKKLKADPWLAAIYGLADRLHQTPATIAREVTVDDVLYFLARDAILDEQR